MANALSTRMGRLFTFGTLYLAEGIPLGFTATAMAAYMRRDGLDIAQIGAFVGMLYLPWGFKWAWAPLIDLLRFERFGGRTAWIVTAMALMITTLVALALVDYKTNFSLVLALIFLHNVFAATQDVAIDSLAVSTLRDGERGTGNGVMFGSAYVGQGLGGGVALLISGALGFSVALIYVCVLLAAILCFALFFVRDPDLGKAIVERGENLLTAFVASVKRLVLEMYRGMFRSGKGPIIGVLFALTPLGAMSLVNAIGTTLQVDFGLSDSSIAQISLYTTALSGLGCLLGGMLGDYFGLRKMIALFYAISSLPVLYLATHWGMNPSVPDISQAAFYAVFLAAGLCNGLHYGISTAVYMGLTNPLVAATQFTAFMALFNLTIFYTNSWQGYFSEHISYSFVLYIDAFLVLIPILLLPFMTPREVDVDLIRS